MICYGPYLRLPASRAVPFCAPRSAPVMRWPSLVFQRVPLVTRALFLKCMYRPCVTPLPGRLKVIKMTNSISKLIAPIGWNPPDNYFISYDFTPSLKTPATCVLTRVSDRATCVLLFGPPDLPVPSKEEINACFPKKTQDEEAPANID